MSFFSPWQDDKPSRDLALALGFFMILLLLGIYVNFQDNAAEQTRAMIFFLMLFFSVVFGVLDWGAKGQTYGKATEFVQFGSIKKLIISGIVGIAAALLMTGTISIGIPHSVVPLIIGGLDLTFFYLVIVAPYCEEKFFACLVGPTSYRLFGGILGLIITCAAFGFFHGFAYGWDYNLMAMAAAFRGVMLVGNQIFKSTGFSFLAHIANNYLVYVG